MYLMVESIAKLKLNTVVIKQLHDVCDVHVFFFLFFFLTNYVILVILAFWKWASAV